MSIGSIQQEVLADKLRQEILNGGKNVHPLLIAGLIDWFYKSLQATPGQPLVAPILQTPRQSFNVDAYNAMLTQLGVDSETLYKFIKRSRIEGRDLLIGNDVRLKGFLDRIRAVQLDIVNFDHRSTSTAGIFETTFTLPLRQVEHTYVDPIRTLDLDVHHGIITLPIDTSLTKYIDLTFLRRSSSKVVALASLGDIIKDVDSTPVKNIANDSASCWIHELSLRGQIASAIIQLEFELPAIEQVNYLAFKPLIGASQKVSIFYASAGDNYFSLVNSSTDDAHAFSFDSVKAKKIRIVLEAKATDSTPAQSNFRFGLANFKLANRAYSPEGSIILTEIDPGINDRPILSVGMTATNNTPKGSSIDYYISVNDESSMNPATQISGTKSGADQVTFNVARELQASLATMTQAPYISKNAIQFYSIGLLNNSGVPISDFDTSNKSFVIPSIELWTEQNAFKEQSFPNAVVIEIQDARVTFRHTTPGSVPPEEEITAPIVANACTLYEDSTSLYFQLPITLADPRIAPPSTVTPSDRMKTESYGLFLVQRYDSSTPSVLSDVTPQCSLDPADHTKVRITGTYALTDNFKIYFRGLIDSSVHIKPETVRLHNGYGADGAKTENEIPASLHLYGMNYHKNKIYPVVSSTGTLDNTTKYMDFTAVFNIPQTILYETFVEFKDDYAEIQLLSKMAADLASGEYITLRHIASSTLLRLENKIVVSGIKKGVHLLSVMSKPKRAQPGSTAIQNVLEASVSVSGIATKVFDMTVSPFISSISVRQKALQYREYVNFLADTRRVGEDSFSTTIENGKLKLIIPDSGYNVLGISGSAMARFKVLYFDSNLFKDKDVYSRLSLKIAMRNSTSGVSATTPSITDLQFTVRYV